MFLKRCKITIVLLIVLIGHTAKSQKITQFANDTGKFVKDLGAYFYENTVNKIEAQEYMKNFDELWKKNVIAGYYKEVAIKSANAMLAKRMKPYPYFYGYFNTLINSLKNKKSGDIFEDWQAVVEKILAGKTMRGISEFFEMSENIFGGNVFYKTPSYAYYSVESTFKFEYDTVSKVVFKDITLVGVNPRGDSIAIENTNGTYYPAWGRFVGKGGKVSWERCGLDESVNATLKRYTIDCKTGNYTSDSATFVGKQFFDKPQMGKVSDRIITENGEKTYPRFDSYSKRLVVKNIYPDVDYDGGFGMRGAKFVGSGGIANPARIVFRRNNVKFLEVSARAFGMSKEKIVANPGAIKFFLDKDCGPWADRTT